MANKPPALANAPKDYDASYFNQVFRVLTQHLNGQADSTNSAPAFSTSGNLTFTGLGNRIIGDFSNATITNRVQVQTSTVNGNTYFGLLPNGTATQSYFSAHNAADPTNSGAIRLKIDSTAAYLESGRNGTGTYLPLQLFTNGTLAATIDTSHNLISTGAISGTNITAAGDVTGSSVSLATARTINGISFNGTANINQPGAPFYDVGQSPAQTYTQAQTASDLNLCVMAGDYNFNSTSTNRPAGLDQWGFLHVGRHYNDASGNTYVHQTAYDMNGTNVATVYVRRGVPLTGYTCTWSPWVKLGQTQLQTAVTASGTSVDFTGVPTWVNRITITGSGISTAGTSPVLVQLGAGGIVTTGYLGAAWIGTGAAVNFTSGFLTQNGPAVGTDVRHYIMTLVRVTANTWAFSLSGGYSSAAYLCMGGGVLGLAAALDTVRLTTVSGTDTFDAGTFNLLLEG